MLRGPQHGVRRSTAQAHARRLLLLTSLASAACSGARSQSRVETPRTHQPEAGRSRSNVASCRGDSVGDVGAPRDFCVTRFAEDLGRPRHLVAPSGDVLMATHGGVIAE